MEKYLPLFIELRLLADKQGDDRSLVAIAAQFERESKTHLKKLAESIAIKKHTRNVEDAS